MRAHRLIFTALLLLGGCGSLFKLKVVTEVDDESDEFATVVFDVPVPEVPATLNTFELSPAPIEPGLVQKLQLPDDCQIQSAGQVRKATDRRQADKKSYEPSGAVRCTQNRETGDVELYPDFAATRSIKTDGRLSLESAQKVAKDLLLSRDVLPADVNSVTLAGLDRQIVVQHQRAQRASPSDLTTLPQAEADAFLIYTSLTRRVGDYVVDGPGSRMALATDRDGMPQAFVRSWRVASSGAAVKARASSAEVRAEIEQQLLATRPRSRLRVQKIELIYYDGNAKLLQPVYRYVVEVSQTRNSIGHAEHLVGYLRYGNTSEEVPKLGDTAKTKELVKRLDDGPASGPEAAEIKLGAYITRNDNEDWLIDALEFLAATRASPSIHFRVTQRESAMPSMFIAGSADYVNTVNLALVEAHGQPWAFMTDRDCCGPVFFSRDEDGNPSQVKLGRNTPGGQLQHLVMHSCRVVASPEDTSDWARPWWTVFNGLTTIVGYRTSMYINDGAGAMFGRSLAAGASVLAAWFNTVATLNAYNRDPSHHFYCDGDQSMGRPAAISVCGAENVAVDQDFPSSGPPTCLDAWWISDSNAAAEQL